MELEQEVAGYKTFIPQKLQVALIVFLAMCAALSSFNPIGRSESQKEFKWLVPSSTKFCCGLSVDPFFSRFAQDS